MLDQVIRARWAALTIAFFVLGVRPSWAAQITVGKSGGETYSTILDGITNASDGDTVLVSEGAYTEAVDFKGKKITLKAKGAQDKTIISAAGITPKTSVVTFKTGETAESVLEGFTIQDGTGATNGQEGGGIYIASQTTPTAAPTTPTIRRCKITKNTALRGGGILIKGVDCGGTIEDCLITENEATNPSASQPAGAGINITMGGTKASQLVIVNTIIDKNLAKTSAAVYGGGAYIGGTNLSSLVTLTDCTITGNAVGTALPPATTSAGLGGGLYLDTVPVAIEAVGKDVQISGNFAGIGGGIVIKNQLTGKSSISGTPERLVLIEENQSTSGGGGGLHSPSGSTSTLKFSYTWIQNNKAVGGGGGGMLLEGGAPNFDNCRFSGNTTSENGGAIRSAAIASGSPVPKSTYNATVFSENHADSSGGAIYLSSTATVLTVYTNCIFTGNNCNSLGGAVYTKAPSAAAMMKSIYCTFYRNIAGSSGVGGIQFEAAGTSGFTWNCILWDNSPTDYDSGHVAASQINYCDVKDPNVQRAGMFSVDPAFVNLSTNPPDLHLTEESPVLGLGIIGTDADVKAVTKDFDGKPRPTSGAQDLGAYLVEKAPEVKPKYVRGFCRRPGQSLEAAVLDIGDVIYLLRWTFGATPAYAEPGCQSACDANDDSKLDLADATYILGYLFQAKPAPKPPFPAAGEDPTPDLLNCTDWKTAWPSAVTP